jgi:hypothetical protein
MASIDLTENGWRTRLTYSVGAFGCPELTALWTITMGFRSLLELERFRFERDGGNPLQYDFRIWLTGGRVWKQTLIFAGPGDADPTMTFDVTPGWKVSECAAHRDLRDAMVRFRNKHDLSLARLDPA